MSVELPPAGQWTDIESALALWARDRSPDHLLRTVQLIVQARQQRRSPLELALERQMLTRLDVVQLLAESLELPWVDLEDESYSVDVQTVQNATLGVCLDTLTVPVTREGVTLVAAADARMVGTTQSALERMFAAPSNVTVALADPHVIAARLRHLERDFTLDATGFDDDDTEVDTDFVERLGATVTTVATDDSANRAWLRRMLDKAAEERASDVHLALTNNRRQLIVRFRVDGELRQQLTPPGNPERVMNAALQWAGMDIGAKRRPESNRFSHQTPNRRTLDIRAEMLPTNTGSPKLTMRLLDSVGSLRRLDEMGLADSYTETLRRHMVKSSGLIVTSGPTGSGKALALSTPIPTPTGLTTMGELCVGDEVFDRDGCPCRVEHIWDINHAPELYRVELSDGQHILADRDHQWLVTDQRSRNSHPGTTAFRDSALQAAELIESHAGAWSGHEPVTAADLHAVLRHYALDAHFPTVASVRQALNVVDCPSDEAPAAGGSSTTTYPAEVAFKSLAVRLRQRYSSASEGQSDTFRMTTAEMLACGIHTPVGHPNYALPVSGSLELPDATLTVAPYTFGAQLDSAQGRIPTDYLRSSHRQRLELLKGLMDSQGNVDATGVCELTLGGTRVAADALALVRSLGIKATSHASGAARHHVRFTALEPVFTLPSMLARQRASLVAGPKKDARWLYVTAIEPVAPNAPEYEPARCITVSSPDRTYLCGEGFVATSNTTTQYGLLQEVLGRNREVITIEQPVEYQLDGITQVGISQRGTNSLTWSEAVESALRSDPDVLLVGEVRDPRTAQAAVQAAMTGHLVLTTLHTTSSLGVYARLIDLEVERFLVADQLSLALGQRLVQRLHSACAEKREVPPEDLEMLGAAGITDVTEAWYPGGCSMCDRTGVQGRTALMELLVPDASIRSLVMSGASEDALLEACTPANYLPFAVDGRRLLMEGITSPDRLLPFLTERNGHIVGQLAPTSPEVAA